ncbi:MAG: hypothetical protein Q8R98_12515 [Rubrivivax sp.]|nr:hypothetical protein [Rubrivivax sp.]MDP3223390.1 hypothetical protein [Rubrivivax sp.]MDP3612669.1 hypothetical protein [Rubrivivax sp.]
MSSPEGRPLICAVVSLVAGTWLLAAPPASAQAAKPATAVPAAAAPDNRPVVRTTTIPGKGLFKGDQLSDLAKSRLTDLVIDALGLDVEVALVVPTGPWQLDGGGHTDRDLNEARLGAVRKFLTDRGIDPRRIFVESRADAKVAEPRLDVQLIGRQSGN